MEAIKGVGANEEEEDGGKQQKMKKENGKRKLAGSG